MKTTNNSASKEATKVEINSNSKVSIRNLYVLIDFFGVDANTILNVPEPNKEISIDERLKRLDKKQRNYLKQTFLYMVDHVNDIAS